MKRWMVVVGITLAMLITSSTAYAQQPAAPADQHHQPPAGAPAPRPGGPPSGGPGGGMMSMEMCHEMMMKHQMAEMGEAGGMMRGMPMMGGRNPMDPKMMAEMMEMRGEIMKAIGDIMIKHAQKMQAAPAK